MDPNKDRDQQDTVSSNASTMAAIADAVVKTMGKQLKQLLSSEDERRGDDALDEAIDLVTREANIRENNLRVLEEQITYIREMKEFQLNTKSGIQKLIYTRKYRKLAEGLYQQVEYARYRNDLPQGPWSLYLCWLSCKDAFPSSLTQNKWAVDAWHKEGLPGASELKALGISYINKMKTETSSAVESLYEFNTSQDPQSISRNASHAQALLAETTFIYQEFNFGGRPRQPYRHPIIQKVVNIMWFPNTFDIGIRYSEYFAPIPFETIALVLTVVECCIDEWSTGTCRESSWKEVHYKTKYLSHLNSLRDINNRSPHQKGRDLLRQIQDDLLRAARIHAGARPDPPTRYKRSSVHEDAPPDPTTTSGRFTVDELDAAIHDGSPEHDLDQVPALFIEQ